VSDEYADVPEEAEEETLLERSIRHCEESGWAFRNGEKCDLHVVYGDTGEPDFIDTCNVVCRFCGIEAPCEDGE
jgi:hypothetical protein